MPLDPPMSGSSRGAAAYADAPHSLAKEDVLAQFRVDSETGLSHSQAAQLRQEVGANELTQATRRSVVRILVDQLRSMVIYILIAAAVLSFLFQEWTDGIAISIVLVINTTIAFVSEYSAFRSMESLRHLDVAEARVLRDAKIATVAATDLVPGDIVILAAGDMVPADLRLITVTDLQCDESALTGESVPVAKHTDAVASDRRLAERENMAFRACAVTRGQATGIVTATGPRTQIGRIAELAMASQAAISPLEKRLEKLGRQLVWLTLGITALIAVIGIATGQSPVEMGRISVALAVAAVPEGLPVVATIALARGMWRMARNNALVNRLAAVETLGAVTIILTDKTGTLTENRMALVALDVAGGPAHLKVQGPAAAQLDRAGQPISALDDAEISLALTVASLSNETTGSDTANSDPMEIALVKGADQLGISQQKLHADQPRIDSIAFSSDTMMMANLHKTDAGRRMYVKGAPEAVIARCKSVVTGENYSQLDAETRKRWLDLIAERTSHGLRVLALAVKDLDQTEKETLDDLVLVGLVGLIDPARADVSDAIAACQTAGIRIVMVTGDHAGTAEKISRDVGIADSDVTIFEGGPVDDLELLSDEQTQRLLHADIVARVTPEMKLDLVALYQKSGEVVAMIGDGVNDAPALKKSDIGIAMGQRGTDVARDAADMILRDDAFGSIVTAMKQGRIIFANIRSFVVYLLSCNLSEILLIGTAIIVGLPLPLLPIHILFLNFVTDVFPAFALGFGEGSGHEMKQPPRDPAETIITPRHWLAIAMFGILIAACALAAFVVADRVLHLSPEKAVSVTFIALSFAQIWHVFNIRAARTGLFLNAVTRNPAIWIAVTGCMVLVAVAVLAPGISYYLKLENPGAEGWLLAAIAGAVPYVIGQGLLTFNHMSILGSDSPVQTSAQ